MLDLLPSSSFSSRLRRAAIGAACAFIALTSLSTAAFANEVNLQSVQNGLYVTEIGGILAAATRDQSRAVRLETVRLQRGKVAFRDPRSGRFLRAGVGKDTLMSVASPHIRGWETFELVRLGGDKVALRSARNGKFVQVGKGRKARLSARAERPGGTAEFRILPAQMNIPPAKRRPGNDHADRQAHGGPNLSDIVGSYQITHLAADDGRLVRLGTDITARAIFMIDRKGSVSATVGCNRLSARLSIRSGHVSQQGPGLSTKMACSNRAQTVAEANLLTALSNANRVVRNNKVVTFTGRGGRELLVVRTR